VSDDDAEAVQAEKDKRGAVKRSKNGMKACNWWDFANGCYCGAAAGYSSTRADGLFRCRDHGGDKAQLAKSARTNIRRCLAAALPSKCKPSGATNMATGKYNGFEWFGRCCNSTCANAIAKALYQHAHEGVPYPDGFVPPTVAAP